MAGGSAVNHSSAISAWPALLLLGALTTGACTTTHSARTVGQGNLGVGVSLGGPLLTSLGPPIPVPNLFAGVRYGLRDDLDLSAHTNLTSPVIPGIALDLQTAVHWVPVQPGLRGQDDEVGWSAGGSLGVEWMSDLASGLVVVPWVDGVGGYRHRRVGVFAGTAIGCHLFRPLDDHDALLLSPYLGVELFLTKRSALSLRGTWHDVSHDYYGSGTEWVFTTQDLDQERAHAPFGVTLGFSADLSLRPERTQE